MIPKYSVSNNGDIYLPSTLTFLNLLNEISSELPISIELLFLSKLM